MVVKVLNVIGNRPHMIKNAVLSKELRKHCNEVIVHTGQHYDYEMSEIFFKQFDLPCPKYNLNVGSGTHGEMTGRIMTAMEPVLAEEQPDVVLVHGDTDSTFAAATSAVKSRISVAHVEAGLRSYNLIMPEEINRVCVDHISRVLFCPCISAAYNLEAEGLCSTVHVVGDVMVDTLKAYKSKIDEAPRMDLDEYVVATIHRDENTRVVEKLKMILHAFKEYNKTIVFPMHPRTKYICDSLNFKIPDNVIVTQPIGYFEMLKIVKESCFVVTDSGGLQKEAFLLKKPCITLRDETEWIDTLYGGWNKLVRVNSTQNIVSAMNYTLNTPPNNETYSDYYGDGFASKQIVQILQEVFK